MARRRAVVPLVPVAPLALWWQLGLKSLEMLTASGQVIGMRVGRMARAGPTPSARDRKEFSLMVSEKARAATQSGWAAAAQLQSGWWQLWMRLWQQWLGVSHAALLPVHRAATANARRLGRIETRRISRR